MSYPDNYPVDEMELSVRSANICKAEGWTTLGHLRKLTVQDILRVPNAGRKSAREILWMVRELDVASPPSGEALLEYHISRLNGILHSQPDIMVIVDGRTISAYRKIR